MKTTFIFIVIFACISCNSKSTHNNIKKQEIVNVSDKVADWQIDNFTYRDSVNLHDYGIDAWTNGVFYLGLKRWASVSNNSDVYYDWLYHNIGEKNKWQIPSNFIDYPKYSIYHADELCIGQFYLELYDKYKERTIIEATKQRLDAIINNPPSMNMSYLNKQTWTWCDALFMAPAVYLGMAQIENDTTYINAMHSQFMTTYNHLFDTEEKLFFRDDSYFDKREENGEKIFWGRGNGWVIAGLANTINLLPEDSNIRPFYIKLFKDISERLVQLQHEDGFWHASLLDPNSYPSPETSATALITYGLAFGIDNGILKENHFFESMSTAWSSLLTVVSEDGKLGWVQPIGADPKEVTNDMTAVYGVGAFLMAATEIYNMK